MNMNMNKILEIANRLKLSEKDIESITEYLDNNEYGIAFEILCSAIELDNIPVLISDYNEIKEIGEYMKMDKQLWECFRV